jgi:hypothetical protein
MTPATDAAREARAREVLAKACEDAGLRASSGHLRKGNWPAVGAEPAIRAMLAFADTEAASQSREGDGLTARIAEVMDEDGGCWSPCSGCQEGVDGYVSTKDYPYSATFKCQPGGGCRECGGIGVLWQDGAFLASYGEALTQRPPEQAGAVQMSEWLEANDLEIRTTAPYVPHEIDATPTPPDAGIGSDGAGERGHRFGSPPEPVANPSGDWCDAYADWYYQGKS